MRLLSAFGTVALAVFVSAAGCGRPSAASPIAGKAQANDSPTVKVSIAAADDQPEPAEVKPEPAIHTTAAAEPATPPRATGRLTTRGGT